MRRQTPTISHDTLDDPTAPDGGIRLDTPAWFAWLEATTTSRFASPLIDPARGSIVSVMTVRKERRQRGGTYWTVYRRAGRRLRTVYLGRSSACTQARLQAGAHAFRQEAGQPP